MLHANASIESVATVLPGRGNLDNDFKPVLLDQWRDLARTYKNQMRKVFRNVRMHREQLAKRYE